MTENKKRKEAYTNRSLFYVIIGVTGFGEQKYICRGTTKSEHIGEQKFEIRF